MHGSLGACEEHEGCNLLAGGAHNRFWPWQKASDLRVAEAHRCGPHRLHQVDGSGEVGHVARQEVVEGEERAASHAEGLRGPSGEGGDMAASC